MRKPLPDKLRFEILKRDRWTCVYCGRSPQTSGVILHVDHVRPVVLGGRNVASNLVTSCEDCNLGKGARPLEEGHIERQLARPPIFPTAWRWLAFLAVALMMLEGWGAAVWLLPIMATWAVARLARGGLRSW